jgi:TPR repeat protein
MYGQGKGVTQDYAESVRWYRLAAEQRIANANAQFNLGNMYNEGRGVPQDSAEAVRWYQLAAKQGHASAQLNLGIMHGTGQGVPQDDATAHMWFNLAAANGASNGAPARDLAASRLTAAGIDEAQHRARVCMESGYQDCD